MSRGFVKEGDQEEIPIVPPRASLPAGVVNYVTPAGFSALMQEKEALEEERRKLPEGNETERRHATMFIDGKLKLLTARINSARILNPKDQPPGVIRFGATVSFRNGKTRQEFQIVGVDEADIKKKKIAFTAPVARILMGKKVGETGELKKGGRVEILEILAIHY